MRKMSAISIAVLIISICHFSLFAAKPPSNNLFDDWVKQLTAKKFALRKKARSNILKDSKNAVSEIEKLLKKANLNPDLKIELELTKILCELKNKGIQGGEEVKGLKGYLDSPKASYSLGEKITFHTWLQNNSNEPINLVGSLDASNMKQTYPYVDYIIFDQDGKKVRVGDFGF